MALAVFILLLVCAERLAELAISARNTKRLLAEGAVETGAGHYPFIVVVHTLWLAALFTWVGFLNGAVNAWWLAAYFALQGLRAWVMITLGRYWTTRIITPPQVKPVAHGPYRFLRHPNYVVVVLEIAVLPMVFGAWPVAVVFTLLNAVALRVRIKAENQALAARSA